MAHVEEISSFIKQIADNSEDIVNQVKNIDTVSEISSEPKQSRPYREQRLQSASNEALTRTVETLENEVKSLFYKKGDLLKE